MTTKSRREFLGQSLKSAGVVGGLAFARFARGDDPPDVEAMITKAVNFLKPRQSADGSWSGDRKEPGITALVAVALLRSKRVTPAEPAIVKALAYLEQFRGDKGALTKAPHPTYSNAVAIMAFQEANKDGRYTSLIKEGQDFLRTSQFDEGEGTSRDNVYYGGAGYGAPRNGKPSRPDLSNTAFMMEALRDSGLPADDPALQRALIFVSRCQNLKSEFNDQPWADKVNDGGFIYTAADGGNSIAGKTETGGLRSYAGMTYAGLKSMILAGLKADDQRVKAAYEFIQKNYSLDENPGLGQRGLYYYYQTFAKALSLIGKPTITDSAGKEHDWRKDLIAALSERQAANGSWVNKSDSFMEGDPNLVTAYGLLALAAARK